MFGLKKINGGAKTPVLLAALGLLITGCASSVEAERNADYAALDPFEDVNRSVHAFNEGVDQAILEPTARGYRAITNGSQRKVVRNFLVNLRSPVDLGNQILQGDVEGAGNQTFRTVVNTLAGFGGIVDVADKAGYEYEREDFGQTLGVWGVPHGAYVVVPLFGPSSVRDATGETVDNFLDPLRLYLFNIDEEEYHFIRFGTAVVDVREQLLDVIDDLRRNSFDYYAALRSAYFQNREAALNDQNTNFTGPEIPEYDDF